LRRIRNERHVTVFWNKGNAYRLRPGTPNERDRLENPGIDGRIILKLILKK
jgi:hypothetical protein